MKCETIAGGLMRWQAIAVLAGYVTDKPKGSPASIVNSPKPNQIQTLHIVQYIFW